MTMQHELSGVHVVREGYNLDTLGAPFNVKLLNGVEVNQNPITGKEEVVIDDLIGLIGAVVRARVLHPRKLSGKELKFVREALGVQAKQLADFLEISAEHLSRCENGPKAMSASSEKLLRCLAFLATQLPDPSLAFVKPKGESERDIKNEKVETVNFVNLFFSMKIAPIALVDEEPLTFEFIRRPLDATEDSSEDEEKWQPEKAA